MRKTFAEIIQTTGIDSRIEYATLWNLFNLSFTDREGLNLGRNVPCTYEDLSFKSVLDLNNRERHIAIRTSGLVPSLASWLGVVWCLSMKNADITMFNMVVNGGCNRHEKAFPNHNLSCVIRRKALL